jgi:hypothetical protein
LADKVFVAYAAPGSKTECFCREIIGWKKNVLTWIENENLVELGATPLSPGDVKALKIGSSTAE